MADFYGTEADAAELAGVDVGEITAERIQVINEFINLRVRDFQKYHTVEYLSIIGKNQIRDIMLGYYPVLDGTLIIKNDIQSEEPYELQDTDYFIDLNTGIVELLSGGDLIHFTAGKRTVEATYDYGWDSDAEIPTDIVQLANLLMAKFTKVQVLNADADGIKSFKAGDYAENRDLDFMSVDSEFDDQIEVMLERSYRKYGVSV